MSILTNHPNMNDNLEADVEIHDPHNMTNTLITREDVDAILREYGVPTSCVHNMELYSRAFVHTSYTKLPASENAVNNVKIAPCPPNCVPLRTKSNERLEFLGDGVLELIVKYYIYRRFPQENNQGFMTDKKIALVNNANIGRIAYEMGLHRWFLISRHSEEKKVRTSFKRLGCLMEAFIGALFLDVNKMCVDDLDEYFGNLFVTGPGFQMAQKFVENVIERHTDWNQLILKDENYKNILQVKIQKEFKVTPDYIQDQDVIEEGYKMGVFLCMGHRIHEVKYTDAQSINDFSSFAQMQEKLVETGVLFVKMGECLHKIKRSAEQNACHGAINIIEKW